MAYGTLYLISDRYGGGVHMWNVPLAQAIRWLQVSILTLIDPRVTGRTGILGLKSCVVDQRA